LLLRTVLTNDGASFESNGMLLFVKDIIVLRIEEG